MVDEPSINKNFWQIEVIPNQDFVFRRVHVNEGINWPDIHKIQPNIFRSDQDGMSVNWNKYATADETLGSNPTKNGVIKLEVGKIRHEPEHLDVIHTPIHSNRAHSSVIGISPSNKAKTRKKLSMLASWVIFPPVSKFNSP
jgi:hypothetical protein